MVLQWFDVKAGTLSRKIGLQDTFFSPLKFEDSLPSPEKGATETPTATTPRQRREEYPICRTVRGVPDRPRKGEAGAVRFGGVQALEW